MEDNLDALFNKGKVIAPFPCPYCGNDEDFSLCHVKDKDGKDVFYVGCPVCRSTGPMTDNQDLSMLAWNLRNTVASKYMIRGAN
jgi:hypothetical protein